jgi:hypothetical protein
MSFNLVGSKEHCLVLLLKRAGEMSLVGKYIYHLVIIAGLNP